MQFDINTKDIFNPGKPFRKFILFNLKSIGFSLSLSVLYLLVTDFLIGIRADHFFLVIFFNIFFFLSADARKLILAFSPYVIYWIVFDYMKAFPNYHFNSVHIRDLYNLEKLLFGFSWNGKVVIPNEYFYFNHNIFLDILSGISYLCWIPVPLLFAVILYFRKKEFFYHFTFTFLIINLIGFTGYYIYPAAPPWYVAEQGFDFIANIPGNTAGFARFDELMGIKIFGSIYPISSNVFAALPSLHAAYMFIVLFFSYKLGMRKWVIISTIITPGIWFAAVYSNHHYILDVLAGIATAIAGIAIFQLKSLAIAKVDKNPCK